jgi:uncharacterized ubiquitin-like protein YukD
MLLTEEEKKEILSKYKDNTSDELLTHLKRTYPVATQKLDWSEKPIKFIQIEDKSKVLTGNKKLTVNRIYSLEEDRWMGLGKDVIRRTIKKFIDGNLIDTK